MGTRLQTILKALKVFFNYGKEHDINVFVINGDFFDQRQRDNPSTLALIQNSFNNMINNILDNCDKDYYIYFNTGNHDELTRDTIPSALDNFKWYSNGNHHIKVINTVTPVMLDNFELFFVPYSEDIKGTKEAINDYLVKHRSKVPTTIFAHLGVNGATQGRWNHRLSSAFNLQDLAWSNPDIKNIVLSHYHTRQSLKKQGTKEAWYIGDLTELNFNDIQSNGMGAPRGFDIVDTDGGHEFIDLTKDPYDLPTFNLIDFDKVKDKEHQIGLLADLSKMGNYIRITTTDKHYYEELKDKLVPELTQVVFIPPEHKEEMQVKSGMSDNKIVEEYCKKYYPDVVNEALDYLMKVKENQC